MIKQKGFTLVETLLVVLILAIVGFGSYYVWHNQHRVSPKTSSNSSNKNDSNPSSQRSTPVSEQAYTTTFSKVSADLQTVILAELKKEVPDCVNSNNQIVNPEVDSNQALDPRVDYDTLGFAGAGIGCGEGAWGIFAKVDGSWQFLAHTEFYFYCSLLSQYHYPKKLIVLTNGGTTQCLDASGNVQATYND